MMQTTDSRSPALRLIARGLAVLASVPLLFMMGLTTVDVVGRYVFGAPLVGAFELTEFAMAIGVFAALPLVTLERRHIAFDVFDHVGPAWLRTARQAIGDALSLVVCAIAAWRLWLEAEEATEYGTTAGALALPLGPLTYYAAIMCAATTAVLAVLLLTNARNPDQTESH